MFWIIEAKSPKDVPYPFDLGNLVQGLQYCIHPEIQAKYLLVSNGMTSAIYDAHGSVFLEKDIYEPVLVFNSTELTTHWEDIFELLSVEKMRHKIAADLKLMYDKLCASSLDENYPGQLLKEIGVSAKENSQQIKHHKAKLTVEEMTRHNAAWQKSMEQLDATHIFKLLDLPLHVGGLTESQVFIDKSLMAGTPPMALLTTLTYDFEEQTIFRKEQSFVGVCELYQRTSD
jgi:hypothetical protein